MSWGSLDICQLDITAVYFVRNYLGLYSVKVISTENSVQRLRNKKLKKAKCDFWGQIRLVRSSPDSHTLKFYLMIIDKRFHRIKSILDID